MEINELRDLFEEEGLYYIAVDLDPYDISNDYIREVVIDLQTAYNDLLALITEDDPYAIEEELDFDDV